MTTAQAVAETNRRSASELARILRESNRPRAGIMRRAGKQIAEAAHGLDDLDAELLADAADEHFDGVGVAVEVLVVEMLDQFGARHHAPGVMHQIGEQPVFVAGELDRIAVDRDAPGARVEPHRPAGEFALGVAGRAAQQRAHARQHLLEMEGLGDVIVGAGVEALHLVAPAVARGQHQHRHGAPGAPPGFQHRNAVHFRQADVEDDRVVGLRIRRDNDPPRRRRRGRRHSRRRSARSASWRLRSGSSSTTRRRKGSDLRSSAR